MAVTLVAMPITAPGHTNSWITPLILLQKKSHVIAITGWSWILSAENSIASNVARRWYVLFMFR
jgi:hypothetical protein